MKNVFIALACLLFSVSAFAQERINNDRFHASVEAPESWVRAETDENMSFSFRHEDHSQIEVLTVDLISVEAKETFFNAFHSTLQSSNFQMQGSEEKSYGSWTGTETVYQFDHSGVVLKVVVFQFMNASTAWIFVGYMHEDIFAEQVPAFQTLIASLQVDG